MLVGMGSEVLKRDIPWETYMTAKLINSTGLQLLRRYDHRPDNVQAALLDENGVAYVKVFVGILRDISKQETVEYMLAMVDEMLTANPTRARLFHDKSFQDNEDVYRPFVRLLSKKNWFIQEKSCKILTLIISARQYEETDLEDITASQKKADTFNEVLRSVLDWLITQLRNPSHPSRGIPTAVSSLATLLRVSKVRAMFVKADGVKLLAPLVTPATNQQYIQLLYEALLCIWLLSFYDGVVESFSTARVISRLVEVVKISTKEKVVRIAMMALNNLSSKGNFAAEMVDLGMSKVVQSLKLQAWNDEDLLQALDVVDAALKDIIRKLSSFDRYKGEVFSGNLDWSPMHKDPVFWRENISKFEESDFQVLRILITLLDNSRDPKTLAVACHDIAQFIQNHPAGRGIILDLKAKERVMKHMSHPNPEVATQALLCVQKVLLSAKYASYMQ
nr:probable V-type proton ATPase subunit H isoform X2 [Physcomitrium patens]|eukprot:XP_024394630.1 probable V-type proton ATPase subunit H isoform X2 [Physcomitrella patens]